VSAPAFDSIEVRCPCRRRDEDEVPARRSDTRERTPRLTASPDQRPGSSAEALSRHDDGEGRFPRHDRHARPPARCSRRARPAGRAKVSARSPRPRRPATVPTPHYPGNTVDGDRHWLGRPIRTATRVERSAELPVSPDATTVRALSRSTSSRVWVVRRSPHWTAHCKVPTDCLLGRPVAIWAGGTTITVGEELVLPGLFDLATCP
jgi:hypothetical protein